MSVIPRELVKRTFLESALVSTARRYLPISSCQPKRYLQTETGKSSQRCYLSPNLHLNLRNYLLQNQCKPYKNLDQKRYFASLTDGDHDLLQFLKEEIKYEEDNVTKLPKFRDFKVDMKDTIVTLAREYNGERIVVSFDVNDNMNVDEGGVIEEDEISEEDMNVPDIISFPTFSVKIIKPSGSTLHFNCTCNHEIHEEGEDSDEQFDVFKFDSVKVYNGEGEKHTAYEAETETMDGELYSILMTMLLERGVTGTFVNDLLDLSTSVEHRHYLTFLHSLKDFVNGK